jgi:hypothetical protein
LPFLGFFVTVRRPSLPQEVTFRMNNPTKPNEAATSARNDTTHAPGALASRTYAPPCIEDDLPLEVMSLACQGFRPKSSSPLPCKTLGS